MNNMYSQSPVNMYLNIQLQQYQFVQQIWISIKIDFMIIQHKFRTYEFKHLIHTPNSLLTIQLAILTYVDIGLVESQFNIHVFNTCKTVW